MWQHEIIEQLDHIKSKALEIHHVNVCEFLKFYIKQSSCFYFGYQQSYSDMINGIHGQKVEKWNIPFNTTLIEYKHKKGEVTSRQPVFSSRRANLIIKDPSLKFLGSKYIPKQLLGSDSLLLFFNFSFIDAVDSWMPAVGYAIIDYDNMNTAYSFVPLYQQEEFFNHKDEVMLDIQDELAATSFFLLFLNCEKCLHRKHCSNR